jgi:hypothetical protein
MSDQPSRDEYLTEFPERVRARALDVAHESRRCEADLYWKLAAYFGAVIGVVFAGYFALERSADPASLYVVACLGFLFSLAWYVVNRAAGAGQRNWESQIGLLEDAVTGPLYKSAVSRGSGWPFEPRGVSPARINSVLALTVAAVWLLLLSRTVARIVQVEVLSGTLWAMSLITVIAAIVLGWRGRSRRARRPG